MVNIFGQIQLSDVLDDQRGKMLREISSENPNKLLNVNETDFLRYLLEKYQVEPIVFSFDQLEGSYTEKMIRADQHPQDFDCRFQQAYPRQVFTFHLPFTGDASLLTCQPSRRILWTTKISVCDNEIRFELINWRDDIAALRREQKEIVERLRQQNEYVTAEVHEFNSSLEGHARRAISERKSQLLRQSQLAQSLNIPIRQSANVPKTFAVPVSPKKIVVKPPTSSAAHTLHPTIDETTYLSILSIIHETGVGMERLPSTYSRKQEEDLRDYFLIPLGTHFPATTGETFNKSGKTDILVKHEGKNLFVGECKFWSGIKAFRETIDQILGYLTWRDSKAAIICFVRNKSLGAVLDEIVSGVPSHPCFVRLEKRESESWTQYEFRLKSDPTRNVHVAVLCFHFPPP